MELVPIIYQILIFVAGLLLFVLIISYIVSRIKKTDSIDEGQDLVGSRITQLSYIHERPAIQRYAVPIPLRSNQPAIAERAKQNSPNIKVIKRSNSFKSVSKETPKTRKSNYYPKAASIKSTPHGKQRYTILNDSANDKNGNSLKDFTGTIEDYNPKVEKFANFK